MRLPCLQNELCDWHGVCVCVCVCEREHWGVVVGMDEVTMFAE